MASVATGTTVVFGTTSFSAEITNVTWGGITRPTLKSSHMGTSNWDTFVPGELVDAGELTIDILFDGDESPPIMTNHTGETVTVTWGGNTSNTMAASMHQTSFDNLNAALEELMTASMTLKVSGAIT